MGTVTWGVITQVLNSATDAGITRSHIRASGRGRRRGAEESKGSTHLRARIKLSRVYIYYIRCSISRRLASIQTTDFPPLPDRISLPASPPHHVRLTLFHPLNSSLLLSRKFSLSPSLAPPSIAASGMAHHFVNQDKLEIFSREIQPWYRLRLSGIYWATTVYPVVPTRY